MFRYLGVGQSSEELSKVYDIRLGESDTDGADRLVLTPKKRRARKRIEQVDLYVDRSSHLPVRVVTAGTDGGTRELALRDVEVNPDLAAGVYQVALPPDVTVTNGTTGLGGALQLAPGPSTR
jgi:outer membrane lipoprotein-sorting protein